MKIAISNLIYRPLSSLLCWLLIMMSVAIISALVIIKEQVQQQFINSAQGFDLVLGAKGSPLQLILSAIYHIDAPTGNIKVEEAEKWMKHPYVGEAIPLAFGDSYKQHSIIGTDSSYVHHYQGKLSAGRIFLKPYELVIGAKAAQDLGLKVGDKIFSTHGSDEHGEVHEEKPYVVTGILAQTQTVIDNLLIGDIKTVWQLHEHHDEHSGEHSDEHEAEEADHSENYYTAVLVRFRNPVGKISLPRTINERSAMMAAVPAIELNRLFSLFDTAANMLKSIAFVIMVLAGLSVFVTLFNSLKDRNYEMALLRTMGAQRTTLALMILAEGTILALFGLVSGLLVGRLIVHFSQQAFQADYNIQLSAWRFYGSDEGTLILITILISLLASFIPAVRASKTNIHKTFSHA
ncbi:MAG: FtsX-like permease family protein [Chitinophagaceae bacterium]